MAYTGMSMLGYAERIRAQVTWEAGGSLSVGELSLRPPPLALRRAESPTS